MKKTPHNASVFLLTSLLLSAVLLLLYFLAEHIPESTVSTSGSPCPTVVLDAGHGGEDGGTVGIGGVKEKDLNLEITRLLGTYLEQNGIAVVYTRTEDVLLYDRNVNYHGRKKILDLAARLAIANQTENSVFVSIHMNAFPKTQYKGLQVYFSKNDEKSEILAQTIQNMAKNKMQEDNDRKIKAAGSSIYLLDRAQNPAVLIECGFLSNPEECALLTDESYRRKLCLVLAEAITEYLTSVS